MALPPIPKRLTELREASSQPGDVPETVPQPSGIIRKLPPVPSNTDPSLVNPQLLIDAAVEEPPSEVPEAWGDPSGVLHAASLWTPADIDKKQLKTNARSVKQYHAAAKKADREITRSEYAAAVAAEAKGDHLPRSGDTGPAALRAPMKFKVSPHRATTAVLSRAYPFMAEEGLGTRGMLIGEDSYSTAAFVYDPWELYEQGTITNPNVLLAGVIGTGKSSCAKCLTTRSIAFGRQVYVPGDPKGEWTPIAQIVGGQAIILGQGLPDRLNPLDEGTRPDDIDDDSWASMVAQRRRSLLGSIVTTTINRSMNSTENSALTAALKAAVQENPDPTIPMVVDHMLSPREGDDASTVEQLKADGREVGHALRRLVAGDLEGLFDGPSTVKFDPTLPMVTLDLSRIKGDEVLLALVMTCASAWMEAALLVNDGRRRWIVYDEAWRIMRQPALLRRMQEQWKLSRAYGIANIMVIHRLSDLNSVGDAGSESRSLAEGLLADCSTRIIYRQEADQVARTSDLLGLTNVQRAIITDLEMGEGLWIVKDRSFRVRNKLSPDELSAFDTNARMRSV